MLTWTADMDAVVLAGRQAHNSHAAIAGRLDVSGAEVRRRVAALGLPHLPKGRSVHTPETIAAMAAACQARQADGPHCSICAKPTVRAPHRSRICARCHRIGMSAIRKKGII